MKKILIIIYILFWIFQPLFAQQSIRIDSTQIDHILKEVMESSNIPGIAVGIAVGDEINYTNVFGYANMECETDLQINSIWHLCSISKQFSTVACLKLVEENKISLEDKISKYLENLPNEYLNITIFNLLSHTSGIKDYLNEKNLYGFEWEKVKGQVFADTLNFEPGDSWSYCNTGFWIVAKIIEKVTGMDYNTYLTHEFFNKLQMSKTQRISGEKIIESRVHGYEYKNDTYCNSIEDIHLYKGQGDGDLLSTLNDLLKWNLALTKGNILTKKSMLKLWTPTKLNNGKALEISPNSGINYGLGWFINDINGEKVVWTPGSGFGFSTASLYVPDYDLIIIIFCNKQQFLLANEIGFSVFRNILN
jgi:CubicO group peptidase (beta-lactamase class C family)